MNTIALTLPYPPSVNAYWRAFRGRVILSKAGRDYRRRIECMFECMPPVQLVPGEVEVSIVAYPPDARRRDIGNLTKCLDDSLMHLGLIEDDSLIRRAVQEWGEIDRENPRVEVTIKPYKRVTP
jgi:crossover junction endodeoxyribonuclease RusA